PEQNQRRPKDARRALTPRCRPAHEETSIKQAQENRLMTPGALAEPGSLVQADAHTLAKSERGLSRVGLDDALQGSDIMECRGVRYALPALDEPVGDPDHSSSPYRSAGHGVVLKLSALAHGHAIRELLFHLGAYHQGLCRGQDQWWLPRLRAEGFADIN